MTTSPFRTHARFVLDVHLGKLARHLRMLGIDSLWRPDYQDDELLRISDSEGRVLLTRDQELHARSKPGWSHSVRSIDPAQQLLEVLGQFSLLEQARSGRGFLTLCLECNSPILPARPDQLTDRVPAHVRTQHDRFFLCPHCERIYWEGSHFDRMREWVQKLLGS